MAQTTIPVASGRATEPLRRALAAGALAAGLVYLGWRTTTAGTGWALAPFALLLATEVWAYLELALLTFAAWRLPPPTRDQAGGHQTTDPDREPGAGPIDVIVVAQGHPVADIERSLLGATALHRRRQIVVVDDNHRPDVAAAMVPFPAAYAVDPDLARSPIARIRHHATTDRFLWLEAGQVPMPDALEHLEPHLDRPDTAVVQSAVDLMNAESLLHLRGGRDDDALIRSVTGPGLSRLGCGPWLGGGSLILGSALDQVSARGSLGPSAGEVQVQLHRAGWTTAFDGAKRIRTSAPETLDQYLAARRTQARHTFARLGPNGPLAGGLGWRPRLALLSPLVHHLAGFRLALQLTILLAVLVTGRFPFAAPVTTVFAAWVATTILASAARWGLARGSMAPGDSIRHRWRTLEADLSGLIDTARARSARRTTVRPRRLAALGQLRLLTGTVILVEVAVLARAVTLIEPLALPPMSTAQRMIVLSVTLATLGVLVDVLRLVVVVRQRRRHHRLQIEMPITINGAAATTVDLSPAGIGAMVEAAPPEGTVVTVGASLPSLHRTPQDVTIEAVVRAATPIPGGGVRLGLELQNPDHITRLLLTAFCVLGQAVNADRDRRLMLAPGHLSIDRQTRHQRSLQVLTGVAVVAGVAVFLVGPSATTALAGGVNAVCVTDPEANPALAVTVVEGSDDTGWTPVGMVGGDGCLPLGDLDPQRLALQVGDRLIPVPAADQTPTVQLADRRVLALDASGQPVAVDIRYQGPEGWAPADPGDHPETVVGSEVVTTSVEISLDGDRIVIPLGPGDAVVRLSRLVAEAGTTQPVEVGRAGRWRPWVDGMEILPGRVTVRLADGQVVKLLVEAGQEVSLPSGTTQPLPPITATDTTMATSTTTTTTPTTTPTTTSPTTPTTSTTTTTTTTTSTTTTTTTTTTTATTTTTTTSTTTTTTSTPSSTTVDQSTSDPAPTSVPAAEEP